MPNSCMPKSRRCNRREGALKKFLKICKKGNAFICQKVTNVQEFTIIKKKSHQTVKKQKNWSALGIDGVQNFWWKKFKGIWSSILR